MNVQDDCAGCVSCFVCLLFGCVYIAATETTANQLQCWKPAWRTDQKGGNQVRYMHTHEQKRQRIHEYDDNDSDGNDNDDNDYTTTTTNTLCMIPNINTSEDKHDDVDHDDDDHSNVDGDGATFYFDCTSAPSNVEYSYEAACND